MIVAGVLTCALARPATAQVRVDGGEDGGLLDGGPSAPESNSASTGTLDLLSNPPGVSVDIDGVAEGVTPLVGIVLSPGSHQVRLRGTGLKTQERTIEVVAGQNLHVDVALPAIPPQAPSFLGTAVDVPLASVILAGTAAALFGVGLGFGIAANDVQHQAGVDISSSGVDLGVTRAQALQGKQYATIANSFYAGAAAVLVAAVVVAIVQPHHASEAPATAGASQGDPGSMGTAWSFW
jgi:hypothetical protein